MKQAVQLTPVDLPAPVVDRCIRLVAVLGLRYGAIDLALVGDTAYFLEINPMGEWAWLEGTFGLQIPDSIVELLTQ
jgi:glutathione synthase/RimK-type ligase-like ATP-grasp enzyme